MKGVAADEGETQIARLITARLAHGSSRSSTQVGRIRRTLDW